MQLQVPGRNRTCVPVIPVQRSNQLSHTEASCRSSNHEFMYILYTSHPKGTAMLRYGCKCEDFVGISVQLSWLERCTGIAGPQVRFLLGT